MPLRWLSSRRPRTLEVEYMELVRAHFHDSPALVERMRVGRSSEERAPPKGSWEEEEEEEEEASSSLSSSSTGVWVLPEEYTGSSPASPQLLGSTMDTCSCLGPAGFLGIIPRSFCVVVVLALYALGKLDFPQATGSWHPLVLCLSRWRRTGKVGVSVFWEFTTRNFSTAPLYLEVNCAVYSTTRHLCSEFALGVQ